MTSIYRTCLFGIGLLVLTQCNYRRDKSQEPLTGETWFQKVNRTIFQPKCVSCHSSPASSNGVDLTSYMQIIQSNLVIPYKPEVSKLFVSIDSGSMPKGGSRLSESELQLVFDWIKSGAEEFPSSPPPNPSPSPTPPPTPEPKFSWLLANVFSQPIPGSGKCIDCHIGPHPKGSVDLSSYKNLMRSDGILKTPVVPKAPEESGVYLQLVAPMGNPKMPPGPTKLSADEIKAVYDWIQMGAENN